MIEKLKALEAAATPGPWHHDKEGRWFQEGVCEDPVIIEFTGHTMQWNEFAYSEEGFGENDARLIEALRNLVPEILAVLEEAERIRQGYLHGDFGGAYLNDAMDKFYAKGKQVLG